MTRTNPLEKRGQVGIETLIIFIAMILVAAVAAGVLINTAGFLQNKASTTSEDSQEQVSNQVLVIQAVGQVNASADPQAINKTQLTVMQSPGAGAVDLNAATIQYIGPHGQTTLTYEESLNNSREVFTVTSAKDDDDSVPVLNSREDRFDIHIPQNQSSGALQPLATGDTATVVVVTQSGSKYTYILNVPETLASYDAGESVKV